MRRLVTILSAAAVSVSLLGPAGLTDAQEAQRIAAIVNDEVVSLRDLDRRIDLTIITANLANTPPVRQRLREQVLRSLVDERLQQQEATRRNITVSDEELDQQIAGLEQQNRIPDGRFEEYLKTNGIDKDTVMTQLRAELAWTKLVRQRLVPTIIVSDTEIEALVSKLKSTVGQNENLLAEILIAVDSPEQEEEAKRSATQLLEQIRGGANFTVVARQFSKGTTAAAGGDIGWIQPGALPEEIEAAVKTLNPGDISEPVRAAGGYYIIALRDRRQIQIGNTDDTKLTLKQIVLPLSATATAADIQSQMDLARTITESISGCADIDSVGQELQSTESGDLGTVRLGDLPVQLRNAVATLKADQISAPVQTPQSVRLLAVCKRVDVDSGIDNERIRSNLVVQRATMLQRRYLRDLRRDAVVELR